ncbi:MoaD/ThiS family protein [Pseudonocardia ailaonensis]|uniref:Molybdopterin synthase sulfur carrier subunit n=1 Tax=Pseudonocardia ailaonensis TaxID=367279 RepID=A0ABN2NG63_9PSEU
MSTSVQTRTVTVEVRFFAAAKAAAGTTAEVLELPAGTTVEGLAAELGERHGPELAKVLPRCSYLLDEIAVRDTGTALPSSSTVDVLPPFAGG